jgi:hypothetical protein
MFGIYEPHPDVQDWYKRAIANGGIVNPKSFGICEDFVKQIELAGLRSILKAGHEMAFIGSNLAAALTPLYAPSGSILSQYNFIESDYGESTGLNPGLSNSTKYINTGVKLPDVATYTSGHFGVYCLVNNASNGHEIGARGGAANSQLSWQARTTANTMLGSAYNSTGSTSVSFATTDSRGFSCFTRNSSSLLCYKNRAYQNVRNSLSGVLPAGRVGLFATIVNDLTPQSFSPKTLSHTTFGRDMTQTQVFALYDAIQIKELSLGRSV